MNYMSYYVLGYLELSGAQAGWDVGAVLVRFLAAWHFWSVLRVASFVLAGTLLAEVLLRRFGAPRERDRWFWLLLACAGGGIVLDIVLKSLTAPWWATVLHGLAGLAK
jgi:hypothetical protein